MNHSTYRLVAVNVGNTIPDSCSMVFIACVPRVDLQPFQPFQRAFRVNSLKGRVDFIRFFESKGSASLKRLAMSTTASAYLKTFRPSQSWGMRSRSAWCTALGWGTSNFEQGMRFGTAKKNCQRACLHNHSFATFVGSFAGKGQLLNHG